MVIQSRKSGLASMRSKSGCLTCRSRKVKCDEGKPDCQMCTRLRLRCEYGSGVACLHDRRLGAGPIKKRQFTDWRPQRIEPKMTVPPAAAAALATSMAPGVSSPGSTVASIACTASSTMSSLSPTVSATPPFLETAPISNTTSSSSSNSTMTTIPMPPEHTEFWPAEDPRLPQPIPSSATAGVPLTSGGAVPGTSSALTDPGLDFGAFVPEDLLAATSMYTSSPFSCLPTVHDTNYMFFGGLAAPLSPFGSSATMALGSAHPYEAPTTLLAAEEGPVQAAARSSSGQYKMPPMPAYDLVSASTPSPLANLILGTTSIVLASLPSRVRLTNRDYEALFLFHQQVGVSIGSKSPTWSTHAILIKLAVHHSAILHRVLAASFCELDWRLNADGSGSAGAGPGRSGTALAGLPASSSPAATPGQLARLHYVAGRTALNELATAPSGTAEAELYHVIMVACFWLEHLISRRHMPPHGQWSSYGEFSRAMGKYVRKYPMWQTIMDKELLAAPSSSSSPSPSPSTSSSHPSTAAYPQIGPAPPPGYVPADEDGDPSGDDEDQLEECDASARKNRTATAAKGTMQAHPAGTLARAPAPAPAARADAGRLIPPAKYRSFLSRLLSWLYWLDCAACFFGRGGELATQFHRLPRGQLGFYETARTTLLDFWDDYTPEEIADDNQNWPALQLTNETWVAVHRLNLVYQADERRRKALASPAPQPPPRTHRHAADSVAAIARDVGALRTRYRAVFRLSTLGVTSSGQRSRLLVMADWAACYYLALELHLLRAGASLADLYGEEAAGLPPPVPLSGTSTSEGPSSAAMGGGGRYNYFQPYPSDPGSPSSHSQAVAAQIVHLAERAIPAAGAVEAERFQWPLFWAGIETDNPVYRAFVLSNLIDAKYRAVLQAVFCEQSCGGASGGSSSGSGSSCGGPVGYTLPGSSRMGAGRLRTICREVMTA